VAAVSDATFDALEDALRKHLLDETGGGYLTGWVLAAASASADDPDETSYAYLSPRQPVHVTLGLLDMAQREFREHDDG